jgi:hypothetical protein
MDALVVDVDQRLTLRANDLWPSEQEGRLWLAQLIKLGDLEIDILNRTVGAGISQLDLAALQEGLL